MMPAGHNRRVSDDRDDLREEIMDIYDVPEWLRQRWRPIWSRSVAEAVAGERDSAPFGGCYQMAGGAMVHVRPGCRCKA